jgi:hypothetical protein
MDNSNLRLIAPAPSALIKSKPKQYLRALT